MDEKEFGENGSVIDAMVHVRGPPRFSGPHGYLITPSACTPVSDFRLKGM